MVLSADLVRWSEQVEGEVRRVASKVEEISGSLSALQDAGATCSSQYSHLEIALQQLVDNHEARSDNMNHNMIHVASRPRRTACNMYGPAQHRRIATSL